MSDVDPVSIKQALRAQLGSQRCKISRSADGRRALEKAANHPRQNPRGSTVQLNVEIREDLKQALANAHTITARKFGRSWKPASKLSFSA
jgi:hypothetical protein